MLVNQITVVELYVFDNVNVNVFFINNQEHL